MQVGPAGFRIASDDSHGQRDGGFQRLPGSVQFRSDVPDLDSLFPPVRQSQEQV